MRRYAVSLLLAASCLGSAASAQSPKEKTENLSTCLSGQYPSLCRYEWLSPEHLRGTKEAERLQNLEACLSGLYPSLCKRDLLTSEERSRVDSAERRENLKICLAGTYASLCNHVLLSPEERLKVAEAERVANLNTCLTGQYPSLCDHSKLSSEDLSRVRQAEQNAAADSKKRQPSSAPQPTRAERACEDGHWIESASDDGEIIVLEDGSVWEVDSIDTVTSSLWLPLSSILICDGRLINTDDDEMVSAEQTADGSSSGGAGARRYEVQSSVDDETFVINGEVFKAKTYCFGIAKGDEVVFVEGNANGACASAAFIVVGNSRKCAVWCE